MKGDLAMAFRFVLPLPGFVLHPLTSVVVCVVHIYLAVGHLGPLAAGDIQWTTSGKASERLPALTFSRRWHPEGLPNTRIIAVLHGFCDSATVSGWLIMSRKLD